MSILHRLWLISLSFLLFTLSVRGQAPAVDSMGINMGKQNWKSALYWALKAGEAIPADKYWRYLNAAEFASRLHNAELTFEYLSYVVHSNIGINASYDSKAFEWLHPDPRWQLLMNKVRQAQEQELQQRIGASQPFRQLQQKLIRANQEELTSISQKLFANDLYRELQKNRHRTNPLLKGQYQYAWHRINDSTEASYIIQLPRNFDYQRFYPLLVVLHGAVGSQLSFPAVPDSTTHFFGRSFMEQASAADMIAIFPYSTRAYNWMMPDRGFSLVPNIIVEMKNIISMTLGYM